MYPPGKLLVSSPFILFLVGCSLSVPKPVSIPSGMRAVAIHAPKGPLSTGDHANVIAVNKASRQSILAENVEVAAVDDTAHTITLLVSQQASDKIQNAASENSIIVTPYRPQ
jgi:hypothetical protein